MDKIKKFLKKLSPKEQREILQIINKIEANNVRKLDITKLSGNKYFFRVRKGKIRIIFFRSKEDFRVISIEFRSESTYKKF